MKSSDGDANFSLILEGKSSESFDINLTADHECNGSEEVHYEMKSNQELEFKVKVYCSEIGE